MQPHKEVGLISANCSDLICKTKGYEIHIGKTEGPDTERPFLTCDGRSLGATSADGKIIGVYLHGLFSDDHFRMKYLADYRSGRLEKSSYRQNIDETLDQLATQLEQNLDMGAILEIAL
jgi:adenosylcobyric acid synthase